jgi:hypothetical protein
LIGKCYYGRVPEGMSSRTATVPTPAMAHAPTPLT